MKTVRRMTTAVSCLGLGRMYGAWGPRPRETAPFANNRLTTDAARYSRNSLLYETHPQLRLGGPTVAWIRAACQAVGNCPGPGVHGQDPGADPVCRSRRRRDRVDPRHRGTTQDGCAAARC